jgi:DNA recombination protein RmuC
MNPFLAAALFVTGAGLGGAVVWLMLKSRKYQSQAADEFEKATLIERLSSRDIKIEELNSAIQKKDNECAALQNETSNMNRQISELSTRIVEERKAAQEKLALLNDAQTKLSDAFKALSAEALNSNNQSFLDLAKTTLERYQDGARTDLENRQKAIDAIVKPVKESLDKFDEKIQGLEKVRIEAYVGLQGLVTELKDGQVKLQSETANLVKALRAPIVRGRWGEIQLKRVVEFAGMVQYCDFQEQQSTETGDIRLRPDMVIRFLKTAA